MRRRNGHPIAWEGHGKQKYSKKMKKKKPKLAQKKNDFKFSKKMMKRGIKI